MILRTVFFSHLDLAVSEFAFSSQQIACQARKAPNHDRRGTRTGEKVSG
jgi:hypothetical protein